ncbi:acyltransferase family protein [Mucilaginibacter litoreus]|uniref:Acyltransferase family protein n=1 Tax=Mucilaginibacter litoreus TaxID=1048221 RepID=A0ABW3AVT8_9SPHI
MPAKIQRNDFISFARGFAILTIVFYHYIIKTVGLPGVVIQLANLGGGGVHLFIFASGFGLTFSSYKGYFSFLKKRFVSVLIPYYVTIVLIFCLSILFKVYMPSWPAFLSHIFLYKMFIEKYVGSYGTQFWFISTIIQFYLLFPLIKAFTVKLKPLHALTISLLLSLSYSLIVAILGYSSLRVWNSFFLQYLWEFVLGMVVAQTGLLNHMEKIKNWLWVLGCLISYLIMFVMVKYWPFYGKNLNDVFSFAGYFCVAVLAYKMASSIDVVKKVIFWVTGFSYALFLIHMLVFNINAKFVFDTIYLKSIIIIFLQSLLLAWIYNFLLTFILSRLKP